MTSPHAELERLYVEAIYEVEFPAGNRRFRIGDGFAAEPFALITAFNPGSERPAPQENESANARLASRLVELGFEVLPGRGCDRAGTHVEPSFAVFGISREDALALASEFRQAAIVWFDGTRATLAWTACANSAEPP